MVRRPDFEPVMLSSYDRARPSGSRSLPVTTTRLIGLPSRGFVSMHF